VPELFAGTVFENKAQVLQRFRTDYPQYQSGWGDQTLYSVLAKNDPTLEKRVKADGAPMFRTGKEFLATFRQDNPDYAAMDDDSLGQSLTAQKPELQVFGFKAPAAPAQATPEPELELSPFEADFRTKYPQWIGPAPKSDISQLRGVVAYDEIMAENARGRAGFGEQFAENWESMIPFYGTITSAIDIGKLAVTAKKMQAGEDVSDQDKLDLNIYLADQDRASNGTWLGKAGSAVATSIGFAGEFGAVALGGAGIAALSAKGGQMAGKSVLQKLALNMAKKQVWDAAATSAEKAAGKFMVKKFGKEATEAFVKSKVYRGVTGAAGAAARMGVGGAIQTAVAAGTQLAATAGAPGGPTTGAIAETELYNALANKPEDRARAIGIGLMKDFIERSSEFTGDALLKAPWLLVPAKWEKAFADFAANEVVQRATTAGSVMLTRESAEKVAKDAWRKTAMGAVVVDFARRHNVNFLEAAKSLKSVGYDGVLQEMAEERLGGFLHGLFGTDGSEGGLRSAIEGALPSTDDALAELLAFSMPMAALKTADVAQKKLAGVFGNDVAGFVGATKEVLGLNEKMYVTVDTPEGPKRQEVINPVMTEEQVEKAENYLIPMARVLYKSEPAASRFVDFAISLATFPLHYDPTRIMYGTMERALASENLVNFVEAYRMVVKARVAAGKTEKEAEDEAELVLKATIPKVLAGRVAVRKDMDPALKEEIAAKIKPGSVTPLGVRGVVVQEEKNQPFSIQLMEELTRQGHTVLQPVVNRALLAAGESGTLEDVISAFDKLDASTPEGEARLLELAATSGLLGGTNPLVRIKDPKFIERLKQHYASAITLRNESKEGSPFYPGMPVRRQSDGELFVVLSSSNGVVRLGKPGRAAEGMVGEPVAISKFGASMEHEYAKVIPLISQSRALVMGTRAELESLSFVKGYVFEEVADKVREIQNADGSISELFVVTPSVTNLQDERGVPIFRWRPESGPYDLSEDVLESRARYLYGAVSNAPGVMESIRGLVNALSGIRDTLGNKVDPKGADVRSRMEAVQKIEALLKVLRKHKDETGAGYQKRVDELFGKLALQMEAGFDYANYGSIAFLPYHGLFSLLKTDYAEAWAEVRQQFVDATTGILGEGWQSRYGNPFLGIAMVEPALVAEAGSKAAGIEAARDKVKAVKQDRAEERREDAAKAKAEAQPKVEKKSVGAAQPEVEKKPEAPAAKSAEKKPAPPINKPAAKPAANKPPAPDAKELKRLEDEADALAEMMGEEDEKVAGSLDADKDVLDNLNRSDEQASLMSVEQATAVKRLMIPMRYLEQGDDDRSRAFKDLIAKLKSSSREEDNRADALAIAEFIKREFTWAHESVERYRDVALVRYRPREKVQAEQQTALDAAMRELRKAYNVAETPETAAQAVAEPGEEEDDEEPSDGTYNEANAHSGELRLEQRLKTGPTGAFFGILKDQTGENGMRVAFQAFSESRKALEAALSSEEMFDRFVKSNLKESAPTALRTVHQALRLLPLSDAVIAVRTLQSVVPRPLLHVARDAQGSSVIRVGVAKNQREYQLPTIVQREFTKIVNAPAAMIRLTELVRAAKQAWMLGDAGARADTLRALLEYISTDPQSATRPRHRWARLTDRIRAGELSAEKLDTAAAIVDGLYVTAEQYAKQNQTWEPAGHGSWTSSVTRLLRGGAKHMRSLNTFEESGVPKSNPGSPALETLAAITSDGELALSSFTPNKHVSVKGYMDEAAIHGAEREPISIIVGVTNVQQRDELDYLDEESSSTLSGDDKIDGNDLTPDQRTLLQRQLFDFAGQAETNPLYFLIPVGERQQTLVWQAPRELLDGASFGKTSAAMSEAWRKAKLPKPATQKEATSLLQKRMGASTTGGPHPSRIKGGVGTHRIAFVADTKSLGGDMLNGGEILTQGYMSQLNYSLSANGRPVYHYKASVFGDVITKTVQYAYLAQNLRRFADAVEAAGYDSFTDDGGFKKLPADAERTSVVVNGVTIEGWKVAVPLKLEHETTNLDHDSKFHEIRIPVNVSLYGSNMRGPAAAEVAESVAKYAETALSFYDAEPLDLASKTRDYQHWTRAQLESAGADALWYPPLSRYAAQFAVGGLRDASRVKGYGGQYVLVPTGQTVSKDHSTKWPFGEDPYITDYPAGGATKRRALARLNFSGAGYRAPLYLIPGLDRAQLVAALEKAVLGKTTAEQKEGRDQFFALVTTIEGKPADSRVSLDDLAGGGRLLLEDLYEGADVPAPLREQGVQVFIPGFAFNSSRTPYSPGSNKYLRFSGWVSTALDENGEAISGRENALQIDAGLISRQSGDYDGDKEHVQVPHLTYDQALGAFVHSRDEVSTSSEQKPDKRAALRARYNDFFRAQDRVFRTAEAAWLFETTDTDFVGRLNIPTKQTGETYTDVLLSELAAAGVIPKPPANLSDAEKAEYVMAQADRPEIQARLREIVMASSSLVGTVVSLFSAYQLTFQHLKATFPVQFAFDFVNPVSGKKESVRFDRKTADELNDSVVMWFASNYPTIVIDDPTKNQIAYLMLNQDTLGMMLVLAAGQKLKTEQEMLAFVQQFRYFIDSPFMRNLRATEAREYARGRSLKITAQLLNPATGKVEETTLYGDEAIAEIMRREGTWDQDAGNSVFRLRNLGRTLQSVGGALTTPSKAPNDLKQWMGRTRALEKALGMRELGLKEVVFEIPGESVSAPIVKAALATLNRYQRIYLPAGSALRTTPAEWGTAALLDYSSAPKKPVPLSRLSAAQLKSLDLRLSQIWGVSAVASLLPTPDAAAVYLLGHPSYGSAGGSGIQKAMPGIAYKLLQTIGDRNPFVQRLNVKRTRSDQPEVVFTVRQDEELTREEAQRVTEGFDAIPRDLPDGLEVMVKVKGQETSHRFSGESLQLMLAWYAIQHYGERGTDLLFAMSPAFHAKLRAAYQSVEEGWAGAPLRTRQETWSALTPKGITSEYSISAWRAWMTTDGRSLALKAMTKVTAAAEPAAKAAPWSPKPKTLPPRTTAAPTAAPAAGTFDPTANLGFGARTTAPVPQSDAVMFAEVQRKEPGRLANLAQQIDSGALDGKTLYCFKHPGVKCHGEWIAERQARTRPWAPRITVKNVSDPRGMAVDDLTGNSVFIGRPSAYGNPFGAESTAATVKVASVAESAEVFGRWLAMAPEKVQPAPAAEVPKTVDGTALILPTPLPSFEEAVGGALGGAAQFMQWWQKLSPHPENMDASVDSASDRLVLGRWIHAIVQEIADPNDSLMATAVSKQWRPLDWFAHPERMAFYGETQVVPRLRRLVPGILERAQSLSPIDNAWMSGLARAGGSEEKAATDEKKRDGLTIAILTLLEHVRRSVPDLAVSTMPPIVPAGAYEQLMSSMGLPAVAEVPKTTEAPRTVPAREQKPVAPPAPPAKVTEEELPASFQAKAAFGGPTVTVTRDIVPATKKGDADEVVWSVRQGTEAQVINEAEARQYWARRIDGEQASLKATNVQESLRESVAKSNAIEARQAAGLSQAEKDSQREAIVEATVFQNAQHFQRTTADFKKTDALTPIPLLHGGRTAAEKTGLPHFLLADQQSSDLCNYTSSAVAHRLLAAGFPAWKMGFGVPFSHKNVPGRTRMVHYVAVTLVDGQLYIVDQPQSEFTDVLGEGQDLTVVAEYRPRLIPFTSEGVKAAYGKTDALRSPQSGEFVLPTLERPVWEFPNGLVSKFAYPWVFPSGDKAVSMAKMFQEQASLEAVNVDIVASTAISGIERILDLKKWPAVLRNAISVVYQKIPRLPGAAYLSAQSHLASVGVADRMAINWVVKNQRTVKLADIKSTEQLRETVSQQLAARQDAKKYSALSDKFKRDNFDGWVDALKQYDPFFADMMMDVPLKDISNPRQERPAVPPVNKAVLRQVFDYAGQHPADLGLAKVYQKMQAAVAVEAAETHERSASGKGEWVHVPRTPANEAQQFAGGIRMPGGDSEQRKANIELLRRLSPSTWCTHDWNAPNSVASYDNYILVVDGKTVAGLEVHPADSPVAKQWQGRPILYEATSIANNGIASIEWLDDATAFMDKYGIDYRDNDSIESAKRAKAAGKTDADVSREGEIDPEGFEEDWHDGDPNEPEPADFVEERNLLNKIRTWQNHADEALAALDSGVPEKQRAYKETGALPVEGLAGIRFAGSVAGAPGSTMYWLTLEQATELRRLANEQREIAHHAGYDRELPDADLAGIDAARAEIAAYGNDAPPNADPYVSRVQEYLMGVQDPTGRGARIEGAVNAAPTFQGTPFDFARQYLAPEWYELAYTSPYELIRVAKGHPRPLLTLLGAETIVESNLYWAPAADAIRSKVLISNEVDFPRREAHRQLGTVEDIYPLPRAQELVALELDKPANAGRAYLIQSLELTPRYTIHSVPLIPLGVTPRDPTLWVPFSKQTTGAIEGWATGDSAVVNAAAVSEENAPKVALHEVAHLGMIRLAKDLGGLNELHTILKAARTELMKAVPELLQRTGHASLDELALDYGFDAKTAEGDAKLLMELAARWAERFATQPQTTWWKQFIAGLRDWFKKFAKATLTEPEVNEMISGFVRYGSADYTTPQERASLAATHEEQASLEAIASSMSRAQDLVQRFKSRQNKSMPPMPFDAWTDDLGGWAYTKTPSGQWMQRPTDPNSEEVKFFTEAQAQDLWKLFNGSQQAIDNDPEYGGLTDFAVIAETVEEWKRANNIVYNPEEAYAKGEGFYHDIGAFNPEAPGIIGRLSRVLLNQQSKLRKGDKTWWKDTENQLLVSAYTARAVPKKVIGFDTGAAMGGSDGTGHAAVDADLAIKYEETPVRPGRGMRFVIRPSTEDIVWAAVGDVYSGTVQKTGNAYAQTDADLGTFGTMADAVAYVSANYPAAVLTKEGLPGVAKYPFKGYALPNGQTISLDTVAYTDGEVTGRLLGHGDNTGVVVDPKSPRPDKLSMLADSITSAIEGRRPQNYNELGVRLRLGNFYIEGLEGPSVNKPGWKDVPSDLQRLNNYLKRAFQIVHGNLDPLGQAAVQPPKSVLAQEAAEWDDFERNYSPISAEQEYTAPQANPIYTPADRATVDALGDRASLASALWSRRWAANQARALGTPEGARLMHRLVIEEFEKSEARQGYGVAEINRDKLIYGDTDDGILYEIIDTDEVKAGKRPMFARGARKELGRLTEREQDQAAMPRWAAAALLEYRDEAGEPVVQNILKDQALSPGQRRVAIKLLFDKVWVTWGHKVKDPHVEQPEDPAKAIYLPAQETVAVVLARFATSSAKSKLNAAGRRDDLHLDWYRELDGLNKFYDSFSEDLMRLQGYVEHRWGVGFVDIETRAADRAVTKDLNDTAIPSTVDFLKENAFIKPTGPVAVRPTTEQLDLYNMLTGETFTMDDLLAHGMTITDLNGLIESELHKRLVIMAREKLAKDPAFDAETYRKYLGLVRKLRESLNRYGLREWAPPMLSRKLKGTIAEIYQRSAIAGRYPRAPKTMDFIGLKQQYLLGVIAAERNRHLARETVLTRDEDGLPGLVMIPSENADIMPLIPDQILAEMGINWAAAVGKRFNPQGNIRAQLITLATETLDPSQWVTMPSPFPSIDRLMVKKGDGEAVVKHWIEQPRKFMLGGVDVLEQLMRVSQWGKMLGVGWSGFLVTSIAESGIAGSAALTAKDNVLWGKEASGTYKQRGPIAALRRMRDIAMLQAAGDPEFTALLYKYARAGIQLGGERILDSASGVFDRDLNAIVESIGDQYGEVAKNRARTGVRLLTARGLSERYFGKPGVRGGLFQASKIYFTDQLARQVAKERGENWDQLTEESQISILRDLSQFINAAYGEDNWKKYLWATPRVVQFLTLALFAPQWTWAAFNIAGGGLLTGGALGNPMTGMTRRLVANNTLAMFTIVLGAIPAMLQLTAYMMGKAAGTGDDDDRPFPEQNEEDRKSYIDVTPIMRGLPWYKGDPTGKRRVYIRFGKQAWEVYGGWLAKPVATLMSKLSVPAKIVYEQVTGKSPGSDWTLEFSGRGLAGWVSAIDRDGEKSFLKSRFGYIAQKYFPMSAMSAIQNQDASVFSFVAPVSHGASAGKATADLIVVLNTVAEDSTWRFARRTPGVIEGLQGLGAAQLDAAARNGYDVDKIVTTAKGVVLGQLYKQFTAALNENDTALMDRIANRILRVGGTLRGLNASVKARRAGANKTPTPEELQAIEAAMGQD